MSRFRPANVFLEGYNLKRFREVISLPKAYLRLLVMSCPGHCVLRCHQHEKRIWSPINYRVCELAAETTKHLLFGCPAIARRRNHVFEKELIIFIN